VNTLSPLTWHYRKFLLWPDPEPPYLLSRDNNIAEGQQPMPILKDIPYPLLIVAAILMALAPFSPEPHLVEKVRLLLKGNLRRPIDIFDLFFHLLPTLLLGLKWYTERGGGR
jgi:hypothetical protein